MLDRALSLVVCSHDEAKGQCLGRCPPFQPKQKKRMINVQSLSKPLALMLLWVAAESVCADLTMSQAEMRALESDNGLKELYAAARDNRYQAMQAGQLSDPKLVMGLLNLPAESLRFDQEPMTQFKLGVLQQFEPGNMLSLKEKKMNEMAEGVDFSAEGRKLFVMKEVRESWLEVLYWIQEGRILAQDESLFRQLVEVTHSLYGVGKVQQKDVLRAELEVGRLHERMIRAQRMGERERSKLSRWIGDLAFTEEFPDNLPVITRPRALMTEGGSATALRYGESSAMVALKSHPMLQMQNRKLSVAKTAVEIEKQKYQPMWGVELSYAFRDGNNPNGSKRTDFVNAQVNLSLPLFTSVRQDRSVQAALASAEAASYSWEDQYQQFQSNVAMLLDMLTQTEDQLALYDEEILTRAAQQAEAALSAYQADTTEFAEVMRAYLSEQKDRLAYERLKVTRLQTLSALHFYLPDEPVLQPVISQEIQKGEGNQ